MKRSLAKTGGALALVAVVAGWPWLKLLFVQAMVAIGVDWPSMDDGDKLNAAVGIVVGVTSTAVAFFAHRISTKHDRYLEEERAKKAAFHVAAPSVFKSGIGTYPLWLTNTGRRASKGYFYLGVPKSITSRVTVIPEAGFRAVAVQHDADIKDNPFDDPQYSHFHDDYSLRKFAADIEVDSFDRRPCAVVRIDLQEEDKELFKRVFLWFTHTPDGRVPHSGVGEMLMASVNEHWIKYGTPEVQKAVEKFYDNTVGNTEC